MRQFDLALFAWMSAGSDPHLGLLAFMSALARHGSWLSVAILTTLAWRKPSERSYLLGALVACGIAALLAQALASHFDMVRPFALGLSPNYIAHGVRGSMPSAHATVMFTFAFALIWHPGLRIAGLAAALVATATGIARVYVGVHFPLDIVAGAVLGAFLAGVLQMAARQLRRRTRAQVTPGA